MQRENTTASQIIELATKGYSVTKEKPKITDPALKKPRSRLDSWVNEGNQFGIDSKTNATFHTLSGQLNQSELESLYQEDWVCRKGVDIPAEDMTRKGVKFQVNEDDENDTERVEDISEIMVKEYDWMSKAKAAISFSRLSGGSATVFNFGGGDYVQRDPIEDYQINDIKWIQVFPAWNAIPVSWYTDFDHPKFLQPEHYQILYRGASVGKTVITHESRVIVMQGRQTTPDNMALKRGWSDSYIRAVYESIRNFQIATGSASETMQDFVYKTLGVKDLADKIMHREDDYVLDRIYLAAKQLTSNSISVYDADGEKLEKSSTTVTGLSDLWDRHGDIICGAFDVPRSIFFSAETGSLGGDASQSDRDNYFDRRKSDQESKLRPFLNKFLFFCGLVKGFDTNTLSFDFNPLREKQSKEIYEERKFVAETDVMYLNAQVITPEEVAVSRFSSSETNIDNMMIDFDEREAQKELDESNEDQQEEIRKIIAEASQPEPIIPEEKTDAKPQVINVRPEINVEAPVINLPKDNSDKINAKLDALEKGLNDSSKKLEDKIENIEFEIE